MVTEKLVVKSIASAAIGLLVLQGIWPALPKAGVFSGVTWILPAAAAVAIGLVVVGPGRVVWDMLTGDCWG